MKFEGKMFQGEFDRIYWREEDRQENLIYRGWSMRGQTSGADVLILKIMSSCLI